MNNNCNWCTLPTSNPKFCSLKCAAKSRNAAARKTRVPRPPRNSCYRCGEPTDNPRFCSSSCAATVNNVNRAGPPVKCRYCGEEVPRDKHRKIYCGTTCASSHQKQRTIDLWLAGETTGLTAGLVSTPIKDWLRRTRGDACELCGWSEVNPVTGRVPVVADHIDGDWRHNRPENLRLICPNCDSLQPTYMALNKGRGRGKLRRN